MTWPQIQEFLNMIYEFPPNDVLVGYRFHADKEQAAKEVASPELALSGLPVRKGKVRRRKDGD